MSKIQDIRAFAVGTFIGFRFSRFDLDYIIAD